MSATVFLDTPIDGTETLECDAVKLIGDVLVAQPAGSDRRTVVPMRNVAGVEGDDIEKTIEAVEYEGGRVTELVTRIE